MSEHTNGKNNKRLVAPITYMIGGEDDILDIDTSGGATTLYIGNIQQNGLDLIRKRIYINDVTGNANTNNITINTIGGNTINGLPALVLDIDGISAEIVIADKTRYLANLSSDATTPPSSSTLEQVLLVGNVVGSKTIQSNDLTATLDVSQTKVAILYSNVGSASAPRLTLDQVLGLARMSSVNGEISLDPTRNFFTHVAVNEFSAPLHYFSTGNVGIGTNTPTEILHVVGNAIIDGKLSVTGIIDPTQIQFSGVGTPDATKYEVGFVGTTMYYNVPVGSTHDFKVGGVTKMTIDASGYLELNGDPITPLGAVTKQYADGLVVGLLDDRGNWDASVNLYPNTNGSGTAGAILKGDIWYISVAGTLGVNPVLVGYSVRALVDSPAQVDANWDILQVGVGYVPENVLNKATTFGVTNNTLYPTTLAVANYVTSQGYLTSVDLTTNVTGILPVANGGTNSSVALVNSRLMVSVGGAIAENPNGAIATGHVLVTGTANNFPKSNASFRWNDTFATLGVGAPASAGGDRVTITSTGAMRGMIISSAVIGAVISTTASGSVALSLDNSSGSVTPNSIVSYTKAGGVATIGQGLYQEWSLQVPTNAVVNKFGVVTTDITAGTYKTKFVWQTPNQIDGTIVDRMALTSNGVLTLLGSIITTGYVTYKQLPNIVNSNTIASTTTETLFTGVGITLSVPASTLAVGDRIKVTFRGIYSRTSGSLTSRLKNNAVTMLSAPAITLASNTDLGFTHEAIITILTIGVGGTCRASFETRFDDTPTPDGRIVASNGTHPINTTILQLFTFSEQWSISNVANTITTENADWEILKAT